MRSWIAVIPARGGSKRLPGKNIMDFMGRPMIAWTITAALESGVFDRVLVSTDDPAIQAVGREWGADTPFLRDSAADDHSPVSAATLRALEQAEAHYGTNWSHVAQLMPNCPLRTSADIAAASIAFTKNKRNFQLSVFREPCVNGWWALRMDAGGTLEPLLPDNYHRRSQDQEPVYFPTGAVWMAESEALKRAGTFYGPDAAGFPIDWVSAVDIDDNDDLAKARLAFSLRSEC